MDAKSMKRQDKDKCLVPGCKNPAKFRGLCVSCYNTAVRRIKKAKAAGKQFDWDTLEAKGFALPKNSKRATALSKALAGS